MSRLSRALWLSKEGANMGSKDKTFALVTHSVVSRGFLGLFLEDLERNGLTIIGMKYTTVFSGFIKEHLSKPGRENIRPQCNLSLDWLVYHLSTEPILVMILKGENAVGKAYNLSLMERTHNYFEDTFTQHRGIYCSYSATHAFEDIEMWFPSSHYYLSDHDFERELIFVFRDNKLRGEVKCVKPLLASLGLKSFEERYYREGLRFILITPAAVKARLVGAIMCAFDANSKFLAGLKLIQVNEDLLMSINEQQQSTDSSSSSSSGTVKGCPPMSKTKESSSADSSSSSSGTVKGRTPTSKTKKSSSAGSSSSTSGADHVKDVNDNSNSFGIAMVCEVLSTQNITLTSEGDNRCLFNHEKKVFEIDRNLVYIAELGKSTWELVEKCFYYGFVLRTDLQNVPPILESSIIGL